MGELKEIVSADGRPKVSQSKDSEDKLSPRQNGMRQGAVMMLLSIILVPAYILLAALFPANDRLVESAVSDTPFEKISQAILITIFMLGLVRVMYARFFQEGAKLEDAKTEGAQFGNSSSNRALPPAPGIPVSGFGAWRAQTGEVVPSRGVCEHTSGALDQE